MRERPEMAGKLLKRGKRRAYCAPDIDTADSTTTRASGMSFMLGLAIVFRRDISTSCYRTRTAPIESAQGR
jgi:hypothetical protein